ncbi:hypothetical protein Lgra_3232 [Legionella gratiana]|uniref:DUF4124 domain-containing protein n=1 Tax=Legionella gratiana TaxID=45066 RepID=A0A378JCD2_9GAMM|nr:DUF4124 domain-containing protein [Legionella gratiana]KTD06455.1 hypothetical protein Lgra_3232 [Legionella gratiana]STX45275.1 Uncharacterised protein [Legionella gratiana]
MNKIVVFLSLMMVICLSYAQIYKWVDSQGGVHFSDTPHKGAEVITLPEEQSSSSPPAATSQISTEQGELQDDNPVKLKHSYDKIEIVKPVSGATIRNNQGFVTVTVLTEPDLFPGDKAQLLYDNAALGEPQKNLIFEINGMNRGSHTLAVQILDEEGNIIDSTDPVTIYVFRPRVGMVPGTKPH